MMAGLKRANLPLITITALVIFLDSLIYVVSTVLVRTHLTSSFQVTYVVERFEDGGWAVLEKEAGVLFDFPQALLPAETREGDILVFQRLKDDILTIRYDDKEKARRLERSRQLWEKLPRGPEGNIEL